MEPAAGETSTSGQLCSRFSLAEIHSATNNFDDDLVIGHGGFGKVYKACFTTTKTNHVVAVKRLDPRSNQGVPEFRAEIEMLSNLRHRHLVSLIGFCNENPEMILVYEYMPHGTLYDHLHKTSTPLCGEKRIKIAIGAARGLDFLHTGTPHGIIHRDIKSSNILLDEDWEAMLSDFGMSKIGPTSQSVSFVDASVKGTFGYLDPEYFYTSKLTRKTDVYAFGVVLFELLSGRLALDQRNGMDQYCSLVRWAKKCVKERKLDELVDSNITGTISPLCLRRFAQIADRCVHDVPKERPTMTEIVASLEALVKLQKKFNNSSRWSNIRGFPWKIRNYIPNSGLHKIFMMGIHMLNSLSARVFSDQSGTSSPQIFDKNMNEQELLITDVHKFTYDELKLATNDFGDATLLGEGRYGKVYKGQVEFPVAVRKLYRCTPFDLDVLKTFQHPNLVKLIGYCLEGERLFLVHEFMHKRNLEDLLCSEIARGIVFLQTTRLNRTCPRVSESPLYRHKILLDEDFTTKLSGYDVTLLVDGQYNIAYPDYEGLELVLETNISGYEVIFIEVLTGERMYSSNRILSNDLLFRQCGKMSLRRIAQLCFRMCNEVESESKMVRMLKEHDELIQRRLKNWLLDTKS